MHDTHGYTRPVPSCSPSPGAHLELGVPLHSPEHARQMSVTHCLYVKFHSSAPPLRPQTSDLRGAYAPLPQLCPAWGSLFMASREIPILIEPLAVHIIPLAHFQVHICLCLEEEKPGCPVPALISGGLLTPECGSPRSFLYSKEFFC